MRRRLWAVFLVAAPAVALAQAPAGPEFQVNSYTTGAQSSPVIASDAAGNFVVVWESLGQDGSDFGVFARRYDAAGAPRGAEFQVNSFTSGRQSRPSVASDAAGNVVVVWSSDGRDGSGDGVFARRYDAGGVATGDEFQVNTFTTGSQDRPFVASDPAGNFVVVWESDGQDGSGKGIFAQRFDAAGARRGAEFQVNTTTAGSQERPGVASDVPGNFVVVWESDGQDGSGKGIFAQRFDAAGARVGGEFRVNTFVADLQERPAVASAAAGDFVVVWQSAGQDGSGTGVFGQRYDASGTAMGGEFQVSSVTSGDQGDPSVAIDPSGSFEVAWSSFGQDGSGRGIFGRRYDPTGAPQGAEFQINSFTAGDQGNPRVAAGAAGTFIVVWQSDGQDGSGTAVVGRR